MKAAFYTLGCKVNQYEAQILAQQFADAGYEIVPPEMPADVYVVNSCTVTASGDQKTRRVLRRFRALCPGATVVLTGCYPQAFPDDAARLAEADVIAGARDRAALVELVRRARETRGRIVAVTPHERGEPFEPMRAAAFRERTRAFVKIEDGCDRYCSFCAIPYIRGRYYSRPESEILDEARFLVEGGVRELVLIGQDTGVWGSDLPGRPTLAGLLRAVADVVSSVDGWVRVLYLQPEGLTQELVDTIREVPQIVPYIDIPLQHASASVLKRMNRTGSRTEFMAMVRRLRDEVPGITLRTTAMVGFPGESEEEFAELTEFLKEAEFDYCAVFSYSQEEGTAAAELPDQVSPEVKLAREQQVIDLCEANGFASASRRIGTVCRVLVDGVEDDGEGGFEAVGRTAFQAPDSDGVVHLGDIDVAMGDFIDVLIEDSACYELFGSPIEKVD